ncbi:MAG: glycosyltransferase [Gemmatimonadota bacterium]
MRVLHCISSFEVGGAERQLAVLASAQAEAGAEVHVAFLRGGPNLALLEGSGVTTHALRSRGNVDPAITTRLVRLIRRLAPDVVQTWLTQMDVAGGLAARLTGRPWILAERASREAYPAGWKQSLRAMLARRADAIVANSAGGAAYWAPVAPSTPRWVIGNAIALESIRSAAPAETGNGSLLFVGRLSAEKRVDLLLEAVAACRRKPRVLLCGDGPERERLERLAAGLGLDGAVVFLGTRRDVWPLMRAARAVVNVSAFEGCPNVVLEAMAAGIPLVVSDIPAHRALLGEASAWFTDPADTGAFAATLERVLADPAEASRRAAEAARRVEAFAVARIVARYDELYRSVLAARRRRGAA